MEKRQTKLVESVGILFQTRVQFPPSPQKMNKSALEADFFILRGWRNWKAETRRCRVGHWEIFSRKLSGAVPVIYL